MADQRLLFDSQSTLCREFAEGIRARSGGALEIASFQDLGAPIEDLRLVGPSGTWSGAEAACRALALAGFGSWLSKFERGGLRRALLERGYAWALAHRTFARRLLARAWRTDGPTFLTGRWLFLRLLGVAYVAAFASLGTQILGLCGSRGIHPIALRLDAFLVGVCIVGAVLGGLVVFGIATRSSLVFAYLLYWPLVLIGAPFFIYQWDTLLLEVGFLGAFLAPPGFVERGRAPVAKLPLFLSRWLLFRLMLLSGLVKVTNADGTWRGLTALDYHFWTQPLPSPLAYYAAHLPGPVLHGLTAAVLIVEVVLPFLVFGGRPLRRIAFAGFAVLLAGISLTGSYGFLNLLAFALSVLLLDDADWRWLRARWLDWPWMRRGAAVPRWRLLAHLRRALATLVLAAVAVEGASVSWARLRRNWELPRPLARLYRGIGPFLVANPYGMYEGMTTDRLEISIEGSLDGRDWRPYRFRYKPSSPAEAPSFAGLHMPRLDWAMWFAALGTCEDNEWIGSLEERLLQGSAPVEALFAEAPFAPEAPRYLRTRVERWRFAPLGADAFWAVDAPADYCPPVSSEPAEGERNGP